MRVLLTGATGYLGQVLSDIFKLNSAHTILRTSRSIKEVETGNYRCDLSVRRDVERLISLSQPDFIIHCAAFVPKSDEQYQSNQVDVNVKMVKNLISLSSARFFNISSMTVYGNAPSIYRQKGNLVSALGSYGESKANVERILSGNTSNSTSIRLPGLFGASRCSGLIYTLLNNLSKEKPVVLPESPLNWAAMDVQDAALCIFKVFEMCYLRELTPRCVNISYDEVYSINRLLLMLSEIFETEIVSPVQHPDFAFDLATLSQLDAIPKKTLKEAVIELKEAHGF